MGLGKSVPLFLADGTPGRLVAAEIMNWTGRATVATRRSYACNAYRYAIRWAK